MKNARKNNEITREDFDSLFLLNVFWNMIISEKKVVFGLNILIIGNGFIDLLFILFLLGEFAV
jgi:hypothetical protein